MKGESMNRMLIRLLLALAVATGSLPVLISDATQEEHSPNQPEARDVVVDPGTTAVLVLDLSARCASPQEICSEIVPHVAGLLDRARVSNAFIVYTVSSSSIGTPLGEPWSGFNRRDDEPVLFPEAWDKFTSGELQPLLEERGIKTLIITGSSSNVAVLYTASAAARVYRYDIVIPMDGINAASPYEEEYVLHQFTVLPSGAAQQFAFTTLDRIAFASS